MQDILSVQARKALANDLEELTSKPLFPRKVVVKAENRCICCLGEIRDGYDGDKGDESWSAPSGAIAFKDQGNFGSRLNDSCYDGHYFEVLICDECLEERRQCIQEVDSVGAVEARIETSRECAASTDFLKLKKDLEELNASIALREVAEEKYKNGTPASELTAAEIEAMKGQYGDDWEVNLNHEINNPEEVWTPERGRIWAEQAIAKAKEERKQRLLKQARKLLRENGEICVIIEK